jgi:hypothetical protein
MHDKMDISFENIGLSCAAKSKNPLKQVHFISGIPFVVIHDYHAQRLSISDKNDTWVEQISVEEGILMKIRRNCL